jgi:hypothetical protein
MRKLIVLSMIGVLALGVVGCGSGDDKPDPSIPVIKGTSDKLRKPQTPSGPSAPVKQSTDAPTN